MFYRVYGGIMIPILKGEAPRELIEAYNRGDSYDIFRYKDSVKEALLKEQGYLCAYCMSRIDMPKESSHIEHWIAQSTNKELDLDYKNMLAVCSGNEGNKKSCSHYNKSKEEEPLLHCDKRKGNLPLKYNPSCDNSELLGIKYAFDGSVSSSDDEFSEQLEKVLNLNIEFLKNNRKSTLDGFQEAIKKKYKEKCIKFDKGVVEKEIALALARDKEFKIKPYCGIILYWLNKKLKG